MRLVYRHDVCGADVGEAVEGCLRLPSGLAEPLDQEAVLLRVPHRGGRVRGSRLQVPLGEARQHQCADVAGVTGERLHRFVQAVVGRAVQDHYRVGAGVGEATLHVVAAFFESVA